MKIALTLNTLNCFLKTETGPLKIFHLFHVLHCVCFFSDKPEIVVESNAVQGGEGLPATLTCHVHADPQASVSWHKNTIPIGESGGSAMARYKILADRASGVYGIVIQRVGIEDFANYTCSALNSMGKEEATIELRGNPESPVFDPNVNQIGERIWKISWLTKSFANITEYRLLYRKVPVNIQQNNTLNF